MYSELVGKVNCPTGPTRYSVLLFKIYLFLIIYTLIYSFAKMATLRKGNIRYD